MSRRLDYAEMKQIMAQYFLLLNGKRPMKGDLTVGYPHKIRVQGDIATEFGHLIWNPTEWRWELRDSYGDLVDVLLSYLYSDKVYVDSFLRVGGIADAGFKADPDLGFTLRLVKGGGLITQYAHLALDTLYWRNLMPRQIMSSIPTVAENAAMITFLSYQDTLYECARLGYDGSVSGVFSIMRGGNMSLLDDKFFKLSHDSVGIPANEGNRGKLRFVKGAEGARDRVYQCMKSDSDTYSWVEIANGGA